MFGPCRGEIDEYHDHRLICGRVSGYLEFAMQHDIDELWAFGYTAMVQEHGVALPLRDEELPQPLDTLT